MVKSTSRVGHKIRQVVGNVIAGKSRKELLLEIRNARKEELTNRTLYDHLIENSTTPNLTDKKLKDTLWLETDARNRKEKAQNKLTSLRKKPSLFTPERQAYNLTHGLRRGDPVEYIDKSGHKYIGLYQRIIRNPKTKKLFIRIAHQENHTLKEIDLPVETLKKRASLK